MKQIPLIIILFMMITCFSCSLYSPYKEITVVLPDIPLLWKQRFKNISFYIMYLDINGEKKEEKVISGGTSCTLVLPKLRNLPVVAMPYGDTFLLPPAGGFIFHEVENKGEPVLVLTWEHGFSASLLMDCGEKKVDVTRFNAERFSNEVIIRSNGDPWKLDYSFIAEKLVRGNFRVTHIKMLPTAEVSLVLGQGRWFFSSPFSTMYEILFEQEFYFENVALGFHRLFDADSLRFYEFFVTEQETVVVSYGKEDK